MSKRVLITGSSRGIGKSIALQLARDGFDIAVHCRGNVDMAEAVAADIRKLGRTAVVLQFDVSNREASATAIEKDIDDNGAYYGAVCNAGIVRDNAFPALTGEEWDAVIHTNLDAFFNVLHPLIMPMIYNKNGGRIVTMSSVSGLVGNRGQTNYSAAKAGLIASTKSLALELGKRNITVNCVAPGVIETEMVDELPLEEIMPLIPLRRLGMPEEVAATVSFLFSDGAAYITRQVISVNGGMV